MPETELDHDAILARREALKAQYLHADRPPSSARGVHHVALLCSDVETTVRFYQDLLEFPLTEMFENRDYRGSTHFFFDIGNGNALAFFDFPGLDLGPYAEVLGGLQHLAISVDRHDGGSTSDGQARRGRHAVRPRERFVAVLRGSRRRAPRADQRPARRDVRLRHWLTDRLRVGPEHPTRKTVKNRADARLRGVRLALCRFPNPFSGGSVEP